jgi:hypothetical protein
LFAAQTQIVIKLVRTSHEGIDTGLIDSELLIDFDPIPLSVDAKTGMLIMAKSTNLRYRTLSKALAIIDPESMLVPGTKEHNWVTETILSWMSEMEPGEVFRMSKEARHIFKREMRTWQ